MKKYQAVPYRLFPGNDGEIIHFEEDSLNLTELSELHRCLLTEFSEKKTRKEVIVIYNNDPEVVAVVDELIELGLVKEKLPIQPLQHFNFRPNVRSFRVVLTEKCNLRCNECFVTKNVDRLRTMSQKTLERVIRSTIPYGIEECITYHFFGGEPLLRFDHIKRAVKILEEAVAQGGMIRPLYTITTNATIITEEIIGFFKEYDFKVGVSMDGPEEINDQLRVYANGHGTFKIIERNYNRLVKAGIDCHVLITPHLDYLDELPSIFLSILDTYPMKTITVNTPLNWGTVQWAVPGKRYASLLIKLLRIGQEFGVSVDSAASPPLAALAGNIRRESPCSLVCDKVMASIGPDGNMSYCSQKWHPFLGIPIIVNAKLQTPIHRSNDCLICEVRGICGGPCPAFQRISGNSLDRNKCDFMRALLKEAMMNLDLFEITDP